MLKKAKVAILLVMALVFALQGVGLESAQAAPGQWSAEELTKTRLLEELGMAASTGVVAETYKQGGHSEANVIVDKVIRSTEDPFLVSGRGNAAMGYDLTAVVELPEYHLADEMTFGVYTREGNRYVETSIARKTVNVADKTEVVIDFGEITDKELYAKELYVLQVENRQPVENNAINQDGLKVEYGETVRGADGGYVYIGSMEYTGQPNQECKIFQDPNVWNGPNGEQGYISELHLGRNIRLYKKVNNRFVQLNDSTGKMEAVNEIYIRDDGWAPNLYLKLMHVTNDGSSYVLYGKHDFEVKYERSDKVAKDLLNKLSELSRKLANTELGVDGTFAEGVHFGSVPKATGNSTDTGAEDGSAVVSLYGVVATEGTLDQGDLMKLDASETQPSALDGKGLPIADNEYVVFNVVVPAGSTTLDMSSASLSYKTSSGALQTATSWEDENSSTESLSRVIWNVVTEKGGEYVPFEGTVYNGQNHGGILLAPKATIEVTATANASTLVGKEVIQGGMEIHQLSFNSATTKLRMTNQPAVKVAGTKYWNDEGNEGARPESITVKVYAKAEGLSKDMLMTTLTVKPDEYGNWEWSVGGLPEQYKGKKIEYYVREEVNFSYYKNPAEYPEPTVSNAPIHEEDTIITSIINTYDADNVVIKGTKVWNDDDDQDGIRPDEVKVTLQARAKWRWKYAYSPANNSWNEQFWSWPSNDEEGWADYSTYTYLGIPEDVVDTITVDADDNWTWSFGNLQKKTLPYIWLWQYEIDWQFRVVEETVDGYTTVITGNEADGYTITNTHKPETVTISGTKRWQTDGSSTPTEVTVRLKYADGTPVKDANGNDLTCKATAADGWKWSFPAQPKYKAGVEIQYTVTEDPVNGYFTEIIDEGNGKYEIVNTIKKVKLQGQKVWDETSIGNSEAYRPGTVYIDVFRKSDDYLMATVFTNMYMSPAWSWSVELPAVDAKGEDAEYYIKEQLVPNYTSEVKPGSTFTDDQGKEVTNYTLTNTFTDIDITVNKVWNDDANADGLRPAKLQLTLMQKVEGGEWEKAYKGNSWDNNFYIHTLDVAAGETSYTFTGLLQYTNDGKKREFRVDEVFLDANGNPVDMSAYTASQTTTADTDGDLTIKLVNQHGDQELKEVTGTIRLAKDLMLYGKVQPDSDTVTLLVRPWESNKDNATPCSLTEEKEVTITLAQSTADEIRWLGEDKLNITFTGEGIYTFSVWELYGGNKAADLQRSSQLPDGYKLDGTEVTIIFDVQENAAGKLEIVNVIRNFDGKLIDSSPEAVFYNAEGKVELILTKEWKGDVETQRPDAIKLNLFYRPVGETDWQLYAENQVVKPNAVSMSGGWTVLVKDLPMYVDGKEVEWSAIEVVPDGYAASYEKVNGAVADRAEHGATITNTYSTVSGDCTITIDKTLVNADKLPGAEVFNFALYEYANGAKAENPIGTAAITIDAVTAEGRASADLTFPLKKGRQTYWLEEVAGSNAQITYATNAYIITIEAAVDMDGQLGLNDVPVVTDQAGNVLEDVSFTYAFTNTYTETAEETTSIKVSKVWVDNNNASNTRPESIEVDLTSGGQLYDTVILNEANGWTYTWEKLPLKDAATGAAYAFTVKERPVAGYTSSISGDAVNGFTITNTYTETAEETTSIKVSKVWVDNNNASNTRPESIEVDLTSGGQLYDTVILNEANDWTYTWEKLPLKDAATGAAYTFTVKERPVAGYTSSISGDAVNGFTITNTYTETVEETTSIKVSKVWVDNNNASNTRPESIEVDLISGGQLYDTVILNEANGWTYTWEKLPLKDAATGAAYTFTVKERPVAGYTSSISGDAANGFTITNTYVTEEGLSLLMLQKSDRLNPSKKLAGAQYTLFTAQTCAGEEILVLPSGAKAVITTGENGIGTLVGVPAGTYWVKETKAPVGYEVDPVPYKVIVELEPEKPLLVEVSDFPLRGALSLSKTVVADTKTNDSFLFDIVLSMANGDPIVGSYEATLNGVATQAVTFTADGIGAKATVSLKDGETLVIHGLRAGAAYTVTERPDERYDVQVNGVASTGAIGTISDTALSVVKFQNTLKLMSFTVKKEWTGLSEGETKPAIQLTLYCNGKAVSAATPKPDQNGWYTYTGLPAYVDGKAAVYTVKEVPVTGFTTAYINKGVTGDAATECAYNGGTIVNSKIPQTGDGTPLTLWMLTTLLAACGLLGVTVAARKREN